MAEYEDIDVPHCGSFYSPLWVKDVNHVSPSSQDPGKVPHALPSKDMWSHLERQVAKHQDPPPQQRHKR